jgi:hypothetical protein
VRQADARNPDDWFSTPIEPTRMAAQPSVPNRSPTPPVPASDPVSFQNPLKIAVESTQPPPLHASPVKNSSFNRSTASQPHAPLQAQNSAPQGEQKKGNNNKQNQHQPKAQEGKLSKTAQRKARKLAKKLAAMADSNATTGPSEMHADSSSRSVTYVEGHVSGIAADRSSDRQVHSSPKPVSIQIPREGSTSQSNNSLVPSSLSTPSETASLTMMEQSFRTDTVCIGDVDALLCAHGAFSGHTVYSSPSSRRGKTSV